VPSRSLKEAPCFLASGVYAANGESKWKSERRDSHPEIVVRGGGPTAGIEFHLFLGDCFCGIVLFYGLIFLQNMRRGVFAVI
jgi:hypothetical protein